MSVWDDFTALPTRQQAPGPRPRLPVLDNLRVAAPCSAEWSKMIGDDRVRHCGDCKKNVFDLSELTRAEAEALIIAKQGRLCVRYFQRADGTIMTKDCSVGVAKRCKRRLIAAGAAAMLAGGGALVWRSLRADEAPAPSSVATPQVIELETTTIEPKIEPLAIKTAGLATFPKGMMGRLAAPPAPPAPPSDE